MFEIDKILKRAWQILWNYKILWIFGLLLALTGARSGSGGSSGGSSNSRFSGSNGHGFEGFNGFDHFTPNASLPSWMNDMGTWMNQHIVPMFATPERAVQTVIWMIVIIFAFCLLVGLLLALVRYPAETATIRMVNDYEETGTKIKFKQGWKLGWNIRAFRMWLVDLLVSIPAIVFVLMILGTGALFALSFTGSRSDFTPLLMVCIGLLLLFGLAFALLMVVLGVVRQYVVRFVAIDEQTVGEAFKQGWQMFKHNFGRSALVWVVLLAVSIGFGVAMMIAFFILIPAYAVLAVPGSVVAAIPGAIGFGIARIFTAGWLPWVIGGLIALPVLLTIMFSPLSFLSGWYIVFDSNVWTLSFRQFKAMAVPPPVLTTEDVPTAA